MGPQRAVAGGGTFKSGVGTGKAVHAILSSSLIQVLHLFCSVIMTPTPQTVILKLFLDSPILRLKFSLFLVHFSLHFSIYFFSFRPDGQISFRPI